MAVSLIHKFKYAFIAHFVVSYFMYRDADVLDSIPKTNSNHVYIYTIMVIVMFSMQLIWRYCIKPIKKACKFCDKDRKAGAHTAEHSEVENVYQAYSFEAL